MQEVSYGDAAYNSLNNMENFTKYDFPEITLFMCWHVAGFEVINAFIYLTAESSGQGACGGCTVLLDVAMKCGNRFFLLVKLAEGRQLSVSG